MADTLTEAVHVLDENIVNQGIAQVTENSAFGRLAALNSLRAQSMDIAEIHTLILRTLRRRPSRDISTATKRYL